jgi:hypothetical protein
MYLDNVVWRVACLDENNLESLTELQSEILGDKVTMHTLNGE